MLSRPTPSGRDEGITKLAPSPPPQFSDSRFPQGMSLDPKVGLKPRTARRSTGFAFYTAGLVLRRRALLQSSAPSGLPAVEGRWDISRRLPASEGFCYEFHVRAPGLVAARQHYAAGSCTLTNMDRLGNGELCVLQGRYTAERPLPVWIPLAKLHSPVAHSPESLGLGERESFGHDRSIMKPGVTTATLPAFSTLEPPVTIQQS
ncbi:hypothetical protein SCUP234_08669 [Seiridium cupressi]